MLDTFKARLKAKTKAAGVNLSQKRIDAYADRLHKKNPDVKEEAEHDTLIDALDELVSFADTAKQDDQFRTNEAKIKELTAKKPDPKTDEDSDDEEDEEEDDETPKGKKKAKQEKDKSAGRMPKWAKALLDEVHGLKAEKSKATIKTMIAAKLKGDDETPKIPEDFYDEWTLPEKEEDIEGFVARVEAKWTKVNPVSKDAETKPSTNGHKPTRSGKTTEKVSEKEVDDVMDMILPGSKGAKKN